MSERTLGAALAARFNGEPRTAIEYRGRAISYSQLSAAAYAIAEKLQQLGVKRGAHVGVLAADASLVVPAALGILAHGSVFALLDPTYPAPHLRDLARDADLACVVAEETLTSVAGDLGSVALIDAGVYASGGSVTCLLEQATQRAVYLYFSSGTTGAPKPILGRADSLLHFVDWEIETLGLGPLRVSQLTFPSHDPYLRDVFTPLVAGGTICIPDSRQVVLSAFELGQWLEQSGVELVHCTPTVFRNLCHGGIAGRAFARLKHVLLAGEPLRGVHVAKWYQAFGDRIRLVNLYGPTETTLAKLYYFVSAADAERAAIPIGRPMTGCRVKVLASPSSECAAGEIGELHIETAYGTLGYHRHPDLNAEVFAPDPAQAMGRPVVYRTGDLVKRLADGNIEFVARKDRQQKVRGKQVDLGTVEDEIVRRTEIEGCIVGVLEGDAGAPDQLVAWYLAARDLDDQALKQRLGQELPRPMIPDLWIRVSSLPTHVNGKVRYAELTARPAPPRDQPAAKDTQARLMALWKELLRSDTIELDDAFMNAGGDSLTIMLLIARLDEEYRYNLTLWQVFDDLTIRKLAGLIDGEAPRSSSEPGPANKS